MRKIKTPETHSSVVEAMPIPFCDNIAFAVPIPIVVPRTSRRYGVNFGCHLTDPELGDSAVIDVGLYAMRSCYPGTVNAPVEPNTGLNVVVQG